MVDEKAVNLAPVRAHVRHRRRNETGFGDDLVSDSIPPGQLPTDFTKIKLPGFVTEGPAWGINDKEMN